MSSGSRAQEAAIADTAEVVRPAAEEATEVAGRPTVPPSTGRHASTVPTAEAAADIQHLLVWLRVEHPAELLRG